MLLLLGAGLYYGVKLAGGISKGITTVVDAAGNVIDTAATEAQIVANNPALWADVYMPSLMNDWRPKSPSQLRDALRPIFTSDETRGVTGSW